MKTKVTVFGCLLVIGLITACAKPGVPGAGDSSSPSRKMDGSIGTIGGGGTLVFSFRHAALLAKQLMETTPDLKIGGGAPNEQLNSFYVKHRSSWIANLQRLADTKEMVLETNQTLQEFGNSMGALAIPEGAPQKVVLSVPYLTVRDGFPESKAIALAIHEAGHFSVPDISADSHPLFDQVAVALSIRRVPFSAREKRLPRPDEEFWAPLSVTDDGTKLVEYLGRDRLGIVQLETGWRDILTGKEVEYLGANWAKVVVDSSHLKFKNLVTNQIVSFETNEATVKTFVRQGRIYRSSPRAIQVYDLTTGREWEVILPRRTEKPLESAQLSPDDKIAAYFEGDGSVSFLDLSSGRLLDFVRTGFWIDRVTFLNDRHVLLSSPGKYDPEKWPFGPERKIRHWVLEVGKSNAEHVDAGKFIGNHQTTTFFMDNDERSLIQYHALTRRFAPSYELDAKEAVYVLYTGNEQKFLVNGKENYSSYPVPEAFKRSIALLDLSKPASRSELSRREDLERIESYSQTSLGPAVLSSIRDWSTGKQECIIRWVGGP